MKLQTKDIYWLAGLIEGDGCFTNSSTVNFSPTVAVKMSDADVVNRANDILRFTRHVPVRCFPDSRPDRQPTYIAKVTGTRAIGWMMTLYPLMGERRQARIRELITTWKSVRENKKRDTNSSANPPTRDRQPTAA